jgi:hypothetical protein
VGSWLTTVRPLNTHAPDLSRDKPGVTQKFCDPFAIPASRTP